MSRTQADPEGADDGEFRSGFVTVVGRPNVGKSTLVNRIVGEKVSITSRTPNTTRGRIRGILHGQHFQAIFVDTPGIHRPKTPLGTRLNKAATDSLVDVDCTLFVIDATAPVGRGDRFIAERLSAGTIIVVNKVDAAKPEETLGQLAVASESLGLDASEFFPVSARTGRGVPELVDEIVRRLPVGPHFYPDDHVRDLPDAAFVAELVREQLLRVAREELPHAIACRVTEWDWPYIAVEILVERDSQKAIVIGKGGSVL
ncbi:MAG TPA: GTPase Era, partial [Acidimicrobiales bacterium]|nr:GTPase Era [Acidimicrobiales bacterium]